LSGVYRSQNDSENSQTLEHWIPVEITLPMNRISRLDDISIEIDNFDVDLLSARTLNITGVLSLRGISAQPVQEQEEIWREEPFTVVHQREAYDEQASHFFNSQNAEHEQPYIPEQNYFAAQEDFSSQQQQPEMTDETEATVTISAAAFDTGWSSSQLFAAQAQQSEEEEVEEVEETREDEQEITLASQQTSDDGWLATSQAFSHFSADFSQDEASFPGSQQVHDQERVELEAKEPPNAPIAEAFAAQEPVPGQEKQELRIAVAGKQPQEGSGLAPDVGFHTLLQTSRREQAARQAAEKVVAQQRAVEEAKAQASGDEIEWKNLFLGKRSEDTEFRKIRVCIVQRDETLDVIASRYSLHPRDILNYNRLDDSGVSEGQLLYIP
jgi:stage VI sporulation protein D